MQENAQFNFTQEPINQNTEFKKERAAYLAQRNARKKQAQILLKKQRKDSSSSDDIPTLRKPNPQTNYLEHPEDTKTNSSRNSPAKQPPDHFQLERQKYKAQRTAYRQEIAKNKFKQFGPSSSEDQSVPVYKTAKIAETEPVSNQDRLRRTSKQQFGSNPFCSLNLAQSLKNKQINVLPSAKLKAVSSQPKAAKQRYEVEVPSKKGTNIWIQKFLQIKQTSLELADRNIPIYDITKIKLFFTPTQTGLLKMKVVLKNEDIFFAVNRKSLNQQCLDYYYFFLAKIITLKLQLMGKKPTTHINPKLGLSEQQLKGAQITGKVRKSSFFGGWEQKIGVVNQSGLFIFKQGKETPIMIIGHNSIQQLWTRFDFDNDNLIIKFLHNRSKVQLSIPFQNFMGRENWLYHIYNLANK